MEYITLKDGTIIDDAYVAAIVKEFDDALKSGKARTEPNPHYIKPLRTSFSTMPKYLQKELAPFFLSA